MKELEKNFYGAVAAYDKAMRPEASQDELARALWRYAPLQVAPLEVVGNASWLAFLEVELLDQDFEALSYMFS